jgi:hypothetical protein
MSSTRSRAVMQAARSLLELAGFAAIVYGVSRASMTAAIITAGILAVVAAHALGRGVTA